MDRTDAQRLGATIHTQVPDLEYDAALPYPKTHAYVTLMYDVVERRHVTFDSETEWARLRHFYQEDNHAA